MPTPKMLCSLFGEAGRSPETGLSQSPAWFVTPEDILLAKLHWFRLGGETSAVQWRDILGVVRACAPSLDRAYLEQSAGKLR